MFSRNHESILERILSNTIRQFHKDNSESIMLPNADDDFVEGNVLFRTPINRTSIQELLSTNRYTIKDKYLVDERIEHVSAKGDDGLFTNVTEQIININSKANFIECMKQITEYKKALGVNFYGALLRDTSTRSIILNPYHILTALSILDNPKYMEANYNIIIYCYSNRKAMDIFYKTEQVDYAKCELNINALMNGYMSKIKSESKSTLSERNDISSERINLSYQLKKHPDEDSGSLHYIVANQLMTNGIISPSYGATLIKLNGDTGGLHLTPQKSCNISNDESYKISDNMSYRSVCTGSLSNRTLTGLRSLSHCNYGSPFSGKFMMAGLLGYIDTMIHRSEQLYIQAEIIEGEIVEMELPAEPIIPEFEWSDAQLSSTTFHQFVKASRNSSNTSESLNITELNNLYTKLQTHLTKDF